MLSSLIFIPLLGSLAILLVPREQDRTVKWVGTIFGLIPLLIVAYLWGQYSYSAQGMQFVEHYDWIPSLGISYYLGTDGLSFPMVILTALISFLAILASWNIKNRVKDYFFLMLLLETGMMGVFVALDYVLFYVFWELVLVPMYFLIGIWGGPRREYAAIKFFLYTLIGSVIMLVGILALYFNAGLNTFDMLALAKHKFAPAFQFWVFLALFFGFAVKVPVFPFHTWLPDAHVEAPTAVSAILAGVLLKMGTYGFLRVSHPTLPEAAKALAVPIAILGLINIIYGALAAMAQKDLKKLVAYSSISHMGFTLLGLAAMTPVAIQGAAFQMFSHGLISAMLFLLVGMIYDRAHTREIAKLGGLFNTIPTIAVILAFASFASLGLPGLSGFVAEFLVFLGSFGAYRTFVIIATSGVVFTAGYYLWMIQRVLMGEAKKEYLGLPDITARELGTVVPLMIFTTLLGLFPSLLMDIMNPAILGLVAKVGGM
ncbi:MAG: NADH-quinone oxidoreductase subunit M [Firmicutes bacterium]|nr:NADH-quinone oxidoreductase subunit M [Bacillota bacterium]MCL5039023.1 NADH-quinone oxidoreductase subunit M [Bacillota bacterium]